MRDRIRQKGKKLEMQVLRYRRPIVLVLKVLLITAAFATAWLLRFDMKLLPDQWRVFLGLLPAVIIIKLLVFHYVGVDRGWWRYVSMSDLIDLLKANIGGSISVLIYIVFVRGIQGVPRTVLVLDGVLCFLFMGGVRFTVRAIRENYLRFSPLDANGLEKTIIVGAGQAGQMIVKEIRSNPGLNLFICGYVDDDPAKRGARIQGEEVLGSTGELKELVPAYRVSQVIIAIPSASGKDIRRIVEHCRGVRVKYQILPRVGDLITGRVLVSQLRDVDVEDLLGRDPVIMDMDGIRAYLMGRRILVTGACGSIGSEICRQIMRFKPVSLVLMDNAETPLFYLERELAEYGNYLELVPVLADVRDASRVKSVFQKFKPEVVFHAAAYKHVPMMEKNLCEAVSNNIRGSQVMADVSDFFGVEKFVMISTDKAVNPTSIMGASKRAAEKYVQGLSRMSKTQFVTVRFGNVLGSAGSVVPIFKEQICRGGPVQVTNPEATRFFMTIPEATQLVLQAGSMGKGGEIFILEMGEQIKIVKLAEDLIRLSGFEPYEEIDIKFIGLRAGEKLHEELFISGEGVKPTSHEKIKVAECNHVEWEKLNEALEGLYEVAGRSEQQAITHRLAAIVPEFSTSLPDPKGEEAKVLCFKKRQ